MIQAIVEVVPRERVTLVVASGTHTGDAGVVPGPYRDLPVVVHDAHRLDRCADLGVTRRGTRVRILDVVAHADLVVVTGRLRPHYFAGYSGGAKGLFPGCGYADDILQNHLLKADPSARLGILDDNPCRVDLEEAALRVRGNVAILNVLCDVDGAPHAVVSGHPVLAHRTLAERAEDLFRVSVPGTRTLVVADCPPVTRSLYQASKLLPPAGAVLEPGGTVVLVAECSEGIEPVARVNDGIYRLGVSRALPTPHRVLLVSTLGKEVVDRSYAEYAPDLTTALDIAGVPRDGEVPVLFRASEAIVERAPA